MTISSHPIRVDAALVEAASRVAPLASRSVAQQISHWARLGRQLETSPDVAMQDVMQVLAGERDYDALSVKEQAVVRSHWEARAEALRQSLTLDRSFAEAGLRYAELDAEGNVVIREPEAPRPLVAAAKTKPKEQTKPTKRALSTKPTKRPSQPTQAAAKRGKKRA